MRVYREYVYGKCMYRYVCIVLGLRMLYRVRRMYVYSVSIKALNYNILYECMMTYNTHLT